jgi:peptidoglycan/LPS O-acetylase OafA/YrhL
MHRRIKIRAKMSQTSKQFNASQMQYRPEIDGLRGLAVILVIFFHAGFPLFEGGYVGVDIFFVISGYLITKIIVDHLQAGTFSFMQFYEHRARRILPALYAVQIACLPFAWLWLIPNAYMDFSRSIIAVGAFSSNILFWRSDGYFDSAAELKPLLHTWSLAIEEQYYLLIPPIIFGIWHISKKAIFPFFFTVTIISLAASQHWQATNPSTAFYILPARAWELAIGALISLIPRQNEQGGIRSDGHEWWSLLGASFLAYSIATFNKSTLHPGIITLIPTLGTALILRFASRQTTIGRMLSNSALVKVGLISYSAYLWHQPIFAFTRNRYPEHTYPWMLCVLIIITFCFAYASWKYIETPWRNKQIKSRREMLGVSATLTVALLAIGFVGLQTNGFLEQRTSPEQFAMLLTASASPMRNACHATASNHKKPEDACEYFSGKPTWASFGDSHAVEISYALAEALSQRNQSVKHYSFSSCPPTFDRVAAISDKECWDWTKQAIAYIAKNQDIRDVLVTYRINRWLYGEHEATYPNFPNTVSEAERTAVWHSYIGLMKYLVAQGKSVHLVLQAPELPEPIDKTIFKSSQLTGTIKGVTKAWWTQRSKFVSDHSDQIPKSVQITDPAEVFCPSNTCLAAANGTSYYFDDDHMSVAGARLVIQSLLKSAAPPSVNATEVPKPSTPGQPGR